MARFGSLKILVAAVIIIVSLQEASALKCWACSSADPREHCNDPFELSKINDQRPWSLVECELPLYVIYNRSNTFAYNPRSLCKKSVEDVNGLKIIRRSCVWEDQHAPKDECTSKSTSSLIKTEFCATCSTDGCNGAAQYGPFTLLVAFPILIASVPFS